MRLDASQGNLLRLSRQGKTRCYAETRVVAGCYGQNNRFDGFMEGGDFNRQGHFGDGKTGLFPDNDYCSRGGENRFCASPVLARPKNKRLGSLQAFDFHGRGTRARTLDLRIKSPLLYQLSYTPREGADYKRSSLGLQAG